jgi:hypothetical protein
MNVPATQRRWNIARDNPAVIPGARPLCLPFV